MRRPIFLLLFMVVTSASAQVRIHDVGVRLLAKPFGIEKRIELQSIDGLYCKGTDSKRLVFTLRNSGVKEVILKQPVFSLDVVLPNGKWASLGSLSGCTITFPITGESNKMSRTYIAELQSKLTRADLEAYLRQAAASSAPIRLLGKAELLVGENGRTEFSKKDLKVELGGPMKLSKNFKAATLTSSQSLPKTGRKEP